MDATIRSFLVLSSHPIRRRFRYKDVFQIVPPHPSSKLPPTEIGHYPIAVELACPEVYEPRPMESGGVLESKWVEIEDAQDALKHILLILTAITRFRFFLPSNRQAWFMPIREPGKQRDSLEPIWGQEQYFSDNHEHLLRDFTYPDIPEISRVPWQEYYNAIGLPIDHEIDLPVEIETLLQAADSLQKDERLAFLSACSLYDQSRALWKGFPSLALAAAVSAIETLIASDHRGIPVQNCRECGQPRYQVNKKFQDFFRLYGSPDPQFKKFTQKVYRYRSKILHSGELFLGDVSIRRFGDLSHNQERDSLRELYRSCRICIVNWLITKASRMQ